uniref:WAP domain-containing protein n=1 Tax=Prolemur simus TaxID=1328070 RepID=A0A8C9DSI7_PROSS
MAPAIYLLFWQAVCPEASASEEVSCAKTCLSDQECLGNSKCCPSACGRSCRTPIIGNTSTSPVAGHCPGVQTPLLPQSCKEQNECSVDSQCSSNKKCCFSRCAMRCLDPVLEGSFATWNQTPPHPCRS